MNKYRAIVSGVLDLHTRDQWEDVAPVVLQRRIKRDFGVFVGLEVIRAAAKDFRPAVANLWPVGIN